MQLPALLAESALPEAERSKFKDTGYVEATDRIATLVSRQPVRPRVQERYERVTVNVRMRCRGEDLLEILYRLESGVPMVIIDDLNIVRPRTTRRVAGKVVEIAEELDIRFNMSGYLVQ